MRRLLALALPLCAIAAHAQEKWVESSVTLSLALSETGDQQLKSNGPNKTTRTVPLEKFSVGNRQILEALKTEGLIPEIKDWSLVAIWAYWPDEDPVAGNTYRFYARKGSGKNRQTVAVPSSILSIAPLVVEVGVKHSLANEDESILSGSTETYKVYTEVRFDIGEIEGAPAGVHSGIGDYKKISGQQAGRYVPRASKAVLSGLFSRDGETADGVIEGAISFGAGTFVNSYDYVAPGGTTYGSVSYTNAGTLHFSAIDFISIGTGAIAVSESTLAANDTVAASSLTKQSSGTLVLSGANTYTGATTVAEGSTLNLGSGATLAGSGGTNSSIGAIGTITSGSLGSSTGATLNLGSSITLSGASTLPGTLVVAEGSTLSLGAGAMLAGGSLTLSFESAGDFVAANGGTFQFFDGGTLNLAPGATFDLSTLSSEQLGTSATFTLNPADGTLSTTEAATQPSTRRRVDDMEPTNAPDLSVLTPEQRRALEILQAEQSAPTR